MTWLLQKLVGRFVTTKVIREKSDVTKVPYQEINNQHDDDRLAVGWWHARDYMESREVNPKVTLKFIPVFNKNNVKKKYSLYFIYQYIDTVKE
jgi:hypothetical protein